MNEIVVIERRKLTVILRGTVIAFDSVPTASRRDTVRLSRNGNSERISGKELDILEFLFEHPEDPVSKAEIMKVVWPNCKDPTSTHTLASHLYRLRAKLKRLAREIVIKTVGRNGYAVFLAA